MRPIIQRVLLTARFVLLLSRAWVNQPNGQQSGRRSTLEGNTLIGTTCLLIRKAELLGRFSYLESRTSKYVYNSADNVAKMFHRYSKAVNAA